MSNGLPKEDSKSGSSPRGQDDRASVAYVIGLYGSLLAILIGFYLAATRLVGLPSREGLILVGSCGALLFAVMLPATISSFRRSGDRGTGSVAGSHPSPNMALKLLSAAALGLVAVASVMSGYSVAAALCAFAAVVLVRNVSRQPRN